MVHVQPFQGLRYNPAQLSSLADVVAPPYDVISPEQQQALYDKSPYNVVRLILGQTTDEDSDTNSVYTRARDFLEAWRSSGVLAQDETPAFYGYNQSWPDGGKTVTRTGFIGRLQVEPFETGQVLPHEWTLGGPKADRLALMKTTGAILSPIFCLYDDPAKQIDYTPGPNAVNLTDAEGTKHTFWPITDPGQVALIQQVLESQSVLIADGHHRYETALAHSQWRREQDGTTETAAGSNPYDYTLSFFTNMADEGLRVYPTHRVFKSHPDGWHAGKLVNAFHKHFEPEDDPDQVLLWLQTPRQPKQGFRLKDHAAIDGVHEVLRQLDVAYLDQLLFVEELGQSANDLKAAGHLAFIRDEAEVHRLLISNPDTVVFWVHAPDVQAVKDICSKSKDTGIRMPQKSTYFYPKLLSGLVFSYFGPPKTGLVNATSTTTVTAAANS
ncbi:MAG: DUF1015 domain-containing protein [Cyanobacteria bacterium HKST-UBA04]|nr:DUF1015 domain-containing protein [Cyanobacteria bacterium HKST-UBA04]MCA9842011.1 DUF1015 domain-containing protein [Cyanobacteria bacterium HKST-UBA03]